MIRPPLIVAEVGNNHEGSLETAVTLLHRAANAGADIVKFQAGVAEGFARDPSDYKRYAGYELGDLGYDRLVAEASHLGIPIMFSVWGNDGFLERYRNMEWFKIAARQCEPGYIRKYDKPKCLISIPESVKDPLSLGIQWGIPLHVVSEYPAKYPNLERIVYLREMFKDRPIGYSDHTIGIDACLEAVERYGAFAIEKHFTLAHDYGPLRDHALSATPEELERLVLLLKR